MTWRFTLVGDPLGDAPERATLALSARGTYFDRQRAHGLRQNGAVADAISGLMVRDPQGRSQTITDSLILLDLIEDLHPDGPLYPRDPLEKAQARQSVQLAVRAFARLRPVVEARSGNALDSAVFFLRDSLQALAARVPSAKAGQTKLTNADIALAPLLWRIGVLDAHFNTYLLCGFEALDQRRVHLLAHPACAALYSDQREADWLAAVRGIAGVLTDEVAATQTVHALRRG